MHLNMRETTRPTWPVTALVSSSRAIAPNQDALRLTFVTRSLPHFRYGDVLSQRVSG